MWLQWRVGVLSHGFKDVYSFQRGVESFLGPNGFCALVGYDVDNAVVQAGARILEDPPVWASKTIRAFEETAFPSTFQDMGGHTPFLSVAITL